MSAAHLRGRWAKINAEHLHASDDSQSRLQDVSVDDRPKLHLLLFCVTALVENPVCEQKNNFSSLILPQVDGSLFETT